MLVLDYDLICAHILLPFVRDTRPPATVVSLDNTVLYKVPLGSARYSRYLKVVSKEHDASWNEDVKSQSVELLQNKTAHL